MFADGFEIERGGALVTGGLLTVVVVVGATVVTPTTVAPTTTTTVKSPPVTKAPPLSISNPSANIAPSPNFLASGQCTFVSGVWSCANPCVVGSATGISWPGYTNGVACTNYVLAAINNARALEVSNDEELFRRREAE